MSYSVLIELPKGSLEMSGVTRKQTSGHAQDAVALEGASPSGTFRIGVRRDPVEDDDDDEPDDEPERSSSSWKRGSRPPEQYSSAWCECSDAYSVFAESVTGPFATDAARLVHLRPGADVLDVAAGTGAFTFAAAERGAKVLATDFSPKMIDSLRQHCIGRGLSQVETAVMDGMNLALPENSFDVSASLFGLMFFPDHMRGLAELFRVTKPGGQAVIATWALPARVELMRLVGETAMLADIAVPSESTPTWLELASERELKRRLLAQGFSNAHVVSVTHVWVLEKAELFAEFLPLMTPSSVSLFERMTDEEKVRFRDVLVRGFHERQGKGPYAVTSQALIAVGTKPRP